MENQNKLVIGLFGFGVVGEGLYRVLQQTPSLQATIKRICVRDPKKKRNAPAELFTTNKEVLLNDAEINVIVEVIDETEAAFDIACHTLKSRKSFISASKKMIAENLSTLLQLHRDTNSSFLYEAAACASIPVIRNLEEYYDNDLLQGVRAIVNGSTNYILTKIFEEGCSFQTALLQAQQLGFAESNPILDIGGYDAVNKWVLLLTHAYGIVTQPSEIVFTGIEHIESSDARYAQEKESQIKLVAEARKLKTGKVAAFLLPQFVENNDPLAFVKNEYNGVVIESGLADKQFFYGKGAGSFPTASAILSDLSALRYNYRYEYKKWLHHIPPMLTQDFYLRVYLSFNNWKDIPHEEFEWIEEWHTASERNYLVGVIHFSSLANQTWWKENGNSLIVQPNSIIEEIETKNIKKRSLELACKPPAFFNQFELVKDFDTY